MRQALGVELLEVPFGSLRGFDRDDHAEAFRAFRRSSTAIVARKRHLREAAPASAALEAVCRLALPHESLDGPRARAFFETWFRPCRVIEGGSGGVARGFLTGYYEPVVDASLTRTRMFTAPVFAPSVDLRLSSSTSPGEEGCGPWPDRATIEDAAEQGHGTPIVWLRDKVEVFFVQVQGSARVRLENGESARLVYAGRNGWPYTSIGKILIESGEISSADMSLSRLRQWIRDHGQNAGERGAALMRRNQSYVFFRLEPDRDPTEGPIGGQGIPLTPLRSIAIDRAFSTYGMPVWISADLPWERDEPTPFRRLMIAQDTGTAIVGPARADIFFGSGEAAGARAGAIRHEADFVTLVPNQQSLGR